MTKSAKKKPDEYFIIEWFNEHPGLGTLAICILIIVFTILALFWNKSDQLSKEEIIDNWIANERENIEEYDAGIDQAKADAHLFGTVANNLPDLISYYHLYNQSDDNFVCRHRAIRIVAEYLLMKGEDEICIVTGFLYSERGMTFFPSEDHTGSGHAWIEHHGQEYDYLAEKDYLIKIPLAKRCYTAYSLGPTGLYNEGFEQLYKLYTRA